MEGWRTEKRGRTQAAPEGQQILSDLPDGFFIQNERNGYDYFTYTLGSL